MNSECENSENDGSYMDKESWRQDGVSLVFMREASLFGTRKPEKNEWIQHLELYDVIGNVVDKSHITGLQRVNGMWRIYIDNLPDKVALMSQGVPLRGRTMPILRTNPNRLDSKNTVKIRVKNIPLSVDDETLTRTLTLKGLDVISKYREKLRFAGKLTNCETGDRIFIVSSLSLKEPLPSFIMFGRFKGRVIHYGQNQYGTMRTLSCSKCLQEGHRIRDCPNEWTCKQCHKSGHKQSECYTDEAPSEDPSDSESECTEDESTDSIVQQTTNQENPVMPRAANGKSTSKQTTSGPNSPAAREIPVKARASDGKTTATTDTPMRPNKKKPNVCSTTTEQKKLTQFVTGANAANLTPCKDRQMKSKERSPPTQRRNCEKKTKKAKNK